jgi:hypothetical protein
VEHKDRPSIESVFRDANRKHPDEWEDDTSFPPVNGVRVQRRKKKGPDWIKGVARQSSFGFVLLELDTQIQHSSEAREEPWGSVLSKLQANVEAVDASWERLRPQFARFSQGKCSCGPIRDMSRTGLVVAIGRLVLDADALPSTGVAIDPVPALGSSSSGERQVNHLIRRRVLEALGPFLVDLDLDLRHELDQVAALGDELYMPGSLRGRGEQSSTVPSDNSESVVETDDPQVDVNMLVRDGKVWTLRYSGRRVPLQDLKGLRYIQKLVASPHDPISVTDLVGSMPADQSVQECQDDEAIRAIKAEYEELEEDLVEAQENADESRIGSLQQAIEELKATALQSARSAKRNLSSTADLPRNAVGQAIKTALRAIQEVHPEAHEHLKVSITSPFGSAPSYKPPKDCVWQVNL